MTTETLDYEAMADRELDALVAERVVGWSEMFCGRCHEPAAMVRYGGLFCSEECAERASDFALDEAQRAWKRGRCNYSTDPAAAFTVLEAMRARGYFVGVSGSEERWNASIHHPTRIGATVWHDDSMPRAVAIAALRALDAEAAQ